MREGAPPLPIAAGRGWMDESIEESSSIAASIIKEDKKIGESVPFSRRHHRHPFSLRFLRSTGFVRDLFLRYTER